MRKMCAHKIQDANLKSFVRKNLKYAQNGAKMA
jgi:hypothetical protein